MLTSLKKPWNHWITSLLAVLSAAFGSSLFIIIAACLFLAWAMNLPVYYNTFFSGTFDLQSKQNILFYWGYNFVCMGALPALYTVFVCKERLSNIGVCWPKRNTNAWLLALLSIPFCFICLEWLAHQPSFQHYYGGRNKVSPLQFFYISIPYYFIEEFFFRGFIFLNLWKRIRWHGLWITELLFAIGHLTKPGLEIAFSIPVGIILNLLALWTRSALPSVAFHFFIGATLSYLIYIS